MYHVSSMSSCPTFAEAQWIWEVAASWWLMLGSDAETWWQSSFDNTPNRVTSVQACSAHKAPEDLIHRWATVWNGCGYVCIRHGYALKWVPLHCSFFLQPFFCFLGYDMLRRHPMSNHQKGVRSLWRKYNKKTWKTHRTEVQCLQPNGTDHQQKL